MSFIYNSVFILCTIDNVLRKYIHVTLVHSVTQLTLHMDCIQPSVHYYLCKHTRLNKWKQDISPYSHNIPRHTLPPYKPRMIVDYTPLAESLHNAHKSAGLYQLYFLLVTDSAGRHCNRADAPAAYQRRFQEVPI